MNFSLFGRLFRKDARSVWPWIALTCILAAVPLKISDNEVEPTSPQDWQAFLCWLLALMSAVRLAQMDDPCSVKGFMQTRPASPSHQILAKCAVLAIGFIAPIALRHAINLASFRLGLGWEDYARAVGLAAPFIAAAVFTAFLVGLVAPRSGYLVAVSLLLLIALLPSHNDLTSIIQDAQLDDSPVVSDSANAMIQRMLIAGETFAALAAVVAAGIYARSRSWRRLAVAVAGSGGVALLAICLWPRPAAGTAGWDQIAPRSEWPDALGVVLHWDPVSPPSPHSGKLWSISPRFTVSGIENYHIFQPEGGSSYRWLWTSWPLNQILPEVGGDYKYIEWRGAVSGLSPSWYACPVAFDGQLTLADGRIFHSQGDWLGRTFAVWPWPSQSADSAEEWGSSPARFMAELCNFPVADIGLATGGAKVSGQVTLEFRRPVLLGSLPLKVGATFTAIRKRFTVSQVSFKYEKLWVDIDGLEAMIPLRGGHHANSLKAVLYNPVRHQTLSFVSMGPVSSGDDYLIWGGSVNWDKAREADDALQLHEPDRAPGASANHPLFDESWLRDARIYFIESEAGGRKTVPFDFASLKLDTDTDD